jgi:hypothetical protein
MPGADPGARFGYFIERVGCALARQIATFDNSSGAAAIAQKLA